MRNRWWIFGMRSWTITWSEGNRLGSGIVRRVGGVVRGLILVIILYRFTAPHTVTHIIVWPLVQLMYWALELINSRSLLVEEGSFITSWSKSEQRWSVSWVTLVEK